tara:strand:+ start:8941 stop:9435 length:495 start_codon:yes stop_codon:yes gene_type:complete
MDVKGFTLLEMLAALMVMAVLVMGTSHFNRQWLPRQRVIAASNAVLGLIQRARAEAYTSGPVSLCDGNSRCDAFGTTRRLLLATTPPGSGAIGADDIIERYTLPPNTTLTWNRFRGTALHYGARGNLFYQNGHFLICNRGQARKVVINVLGTARIEAGDASGCP